MKQVPLTGIGEKTSLMFIREQLSSSGGKEGEGKRNREGKTLQVRVLKGARSQLLQFVCFVLFWFWDSI